jgi:hypothetical protein
LVFPQILDRSSGPGTNGNAESEDFLIIISQNNVVFKPLLNPGHEKMKEINQKSEGMETVMSQRSKCPAWQKKSDKFYRKNLEI